MKKLTEVEKIVGLTRRNIQEYEKAGVASKPSCTNKYGYLLYSDADIDRLWQLRFYKELDYNIPKIRRMMRDKNYNEQIEMDNVIKKLKDKIKNLNHLIAIAEAIKETGASFITLKSSIIDNSISESEGVFELMAIAFEDFDDDTYFDVENIIDTEFYTLEEQANIEREIETFIYMCDDGLEPNDEIVQEKLLQIHRLLVKGIGKTPLVFLSFAFMLSPECEIAKELARKYDGKRVEFCRNAIIKYSNRRFNGKYCRGIGRVCEELIALANQEYNFDALAEKFQYFYNVINEINILSDCGKLYVLKKIIKFAESDIVSSYINCNDSVNAAANIVYAFEKFEKEYLRDNKLYN